MPEQDFTKRVMNKVHSLVKREPDETPEATDEPSVVEPGDAPVAIHSPRATQQKGVNNFINNGMVGPWLIVLTAIASISLTIIVMILIFAPSYIDAKVSAGTAKAEASAHLARTQALVALDKVEDLRVKLAQKDIDIPPLDGH